MSDKNIQITKRQSSILDYAKNPEKVKTAQEKTSATIFDNSFNSQKNSENSTVFQNKNVPDFSGLPGLFPGKPKPEKMPPFIDKKTRNALDEALIVELYDNMLKSKVSPENTLRITQAIHRIDNINYLKVFNSIESGSKGQELPEMIINSQHLNEEQKISCLKHLTKVGKNYAAQNNQRSDDIIPQMEKIFKKSEKTKTITTIDKMRLLADFRKITDRQDTLATQIPLPPNGKFDGNFKQGQTGNCWLLAGIQSIAKTPAGKKLIDDSVSVDKNGNAT